MFCVNCGKELNDKAIICPFCGVPTDNYNAYQRTRTTNDMSTIIKVFLIIACVLGIFSFLIPLAWCLPMTFYYLGAVEKGEKVSTGFKVCTLLFVSLIAGILMFCEE